MFFMETTLSEISNIVSELVFAARAKCDGDTDRETEALSPRSDDNTFPVRAF